MTTSKKGGEESSGCKRTVIKVFVLPQQLCGIVITDVTGMMGQWNDRERAGSYFRRSRVLDEGEVCEEIKMKVTYVRSQRKSVSGMA